MNTYQALRTLNISKDSTQDEIRAAYRRMALELHPDRNSGDGSEFKRITEAYNHLKGGSHTPAAKTDDGADGHNDAAMKKGRRGSNSAEPGSQYRYSGEPGGVGERNRAQWGAGPQDGTIPEQDWSKFTKHVEDEDPDFWKEYERKFWEDYNARVDASGRNGEYEKAAEPNRQPNLSVDVDESLCIGCCSCEIIAPDVFEINKQSMMNPKSSVINPRGAGINKIMNAAETCPTKAIRVENADTRERLFPH